MADPTIDAFQARNNTKVFILVNGARVGRIQSIREDIANNVQVLDELGRAFAVEMKKGITRYTFSIARFYCRSDVFDSLKLGAVFSLAIHEAAQNAEDGFAGTSGGQIIEKFPYCSITSLSRDYTVGQATVGENATVVTIGKGVVEPVSA